MAVCATCKGTGAVKCPRCQGKGGFSDIIFGHDKCGNCEGSGQVKCNTCKGKGSV